VRSQNGDMIPLGALITHTPTETAPLISHFNLFRSAEVDGTPAPGYSSGQAIEVLKMWQTKYCHKVMATTFRV